MKNIEQLHRACNNLQANINKIEDLDILQKVADLIRECRTAIAEEGLNNVQNIYYEHMRSEVYNETD